MKVLDVGRLNKRITFLRYGETEDSMGQTIQDLVPFQTVWGTLFPVRGMEYYEIQKIQGKITHKCYIRYRDGIDRNCLLKWKEEIFSIESVTDVESAHRLLEIMCTKYEDRGGFPNVRSDIYHGDTGS